MSKQVFVTAGYGEESHVYEADGFYVEGGFLFVTKGINAVATHRQWERAEVREAPQETGGPANPISVHGAGCRCIGGKH